MSEPREKKIREEGEEEEKRSENEEEEVASIEEEEEEEEEMHLIRTIFLLFHEKQKHRKAHIHLH